MNKKKSARIISNIFVPPSGTLLISLFLANTLAGSREEAFLIFGIGATFGFILPIIFFVILRVKGKVADVDATIKEERTLPYIAGIILASAAFGVASYFSLDYVVQAMWLSYASNTIILIIINKYWKISAHAIGNFSPTAILYYLNPFLAVLLVPILLLILWSRLELKKHTPAQLIAGAIFGFGSTLGQLFILKSILD